MYLHAGTVDSDPGQAKAANPSCVGFAYQPTMGGGMTPTVNIMDRADPQGSFRPLAKVEGPTCFGGCSELCFSSEFLVSSMRVGQLETPTKLGAHAGRMQAACARGRKPLASLATR